MKSIKFLIFAGGTIFGLLLAGLFFVSWQTKQQPPRMFFRFPAPPYRDNLIISLYNTTKSPTSAVVSLDNESVMCGVLPGRGPFQSPVDDFSALAAFSPTLGKHELSVIVGNVGKIGTKEIVQEAGKTNFVEIYIKTSAAGTNRFDCNFLVHTNVQGSM
jgi:hypothetical protein